MSATSRLVEAGREAGLLDETGALTGRRLSQDVPVQGANGTRVNPADVRATLDALERSKTMKEQPVAFWFRGTARWQHPGWSYCYNEVAKDNDEFRSTTKKDGKTIQKWLVEKGYRKLRSWKGKGEITTFEETWMHERYAGYGDKPDDFHPKSTAEIREYIALALKTDDDAPSLEKFDAPIQQPALDMSVEAVRARIAASLAAVLAEHGLTTPTTEAVGTSLVDTLTL